MDETGSSSPRNWTLAAVFILLAVAVFSATQWPLYPYFLDNYYHLATIGGFKEAGGLTLHDFWERAPEGRPHLYPPLFHVAWLPLALFNVPPLVMAKLWCWMALPLLLWIAWRVLSALTDTRFASLAVLCLATPYSFFLSTVNYLPATFVLMTTLGILWALFTKRWLGGGILFGMSLLLHGGLPWLVLLSLLIFAWMEPGFRKTTTRIIAIGFLMASPWLIHLARHMNWLQIQPRGEERFLESSILFLGLGLAGFFIAWKQKGAPKRFFAALALGFLPMGLAYRFRFFATQGLFPWLLLSAVALDKLSDKIRWKWLFPAGLGALLFLAPSLHVSPNGVRLVWADTTLCVLAGRSEPVERATAHTVFQRKFMHELADRITAATGPEELTFSNLAYVGGIMNVLTHRATTSEMLREFAPRPMEEQIAAASIIVWVKDLSGKKSAELEGVVHRYELQSIGETEIAYLYRNPKASGRRRVSPAVVPWWGTTLLVAGMLGLLLWEGHRCP